jgi:hypothetical protein
MAGALVAVGGGALLLAELWLCAQAPRPATNTAIMVREHSFTILLIPVSLKTIRNFFQASSGEWPLGTVSAYVSSGSFSGFPNGFLEVGLV